MIEEYTNRFLDTVLPFLSGTAPSVYVSALLGIINTCLFYLAFGRGIKLFPPFLVLGAAGSLIGLAVGTELPATGPMLGEVHLEATAVSTWTILFIARSLRL